MVLGLDESTKGLAKELPPDYRGIAYDDWLDIFLEYAVRLSMDGRTQEAYDMCQSAYEARPFEQISTRRYMITVCMYSKSTPREALIHILIHVS